MLILGVDSGQAKPVATVRQIARECGLPEIERWNVSDALAKARPHITRLPGGWILTSKGRAAVGKITGDKRSQMPKVTHQLEQAVHRVTDPDTREYINEAIGCLHAGLLRAAVVFSWVGAVAILQQVIIEKHLSIFNTEARRRNPKWKDAKVRDDFAPMKESDFLDVVAALSLLGKNVKEQLKNTHLGLRNSCGHPSSLKLGEGIVIAHIEFLTLNVFSKFAI